MTLTPAYGRDYKNKKEVQEAWDGNKDFIITDMSSKDNGRYINKSDAIVGGIKSVTIRYKKLTMVTIIKVS